MPEIRTTRSSRRVLCGSSWDSEVARELRVNEPVPASTATSEPSGAAQGCAELEMERGS